MLSTQKERVSPSSTLLGKLLATKDGQAEKDRQIDAQVGPVLLEAPNKNSHSLSLSLSSSLLKAAAHEETQDVTYAQLCNWMLREGPDSPPSSQDGALPAKASVYAALAPTLPGAFPKETK